MHPPTASPPPERAPWWQSAIFYQIYPRSFADSNGDGIGDFPGITSRLDHLRTLGVDAIWLSPHFPSPQVDGGYDIADYTNVAPEYGTLDDFRAFLSEAHSRGIRVILDLVLNHTSDQHPWFIESRSSRMSPKRDWYVWVDPAPDGGPPNNWCSVFGGRGWSYDAATNQYYYHHFLPEQPDLNWHNPEVKAAMWDAARFWLDMGVDGFRLDAVGAIYEHPDLRDHTSPLSYTEIYLKRRRAQTPEEFQQVRVDWDTLFGLQMQQPGIHELMRELRALLDSYPGDRVLVGEDDNLAFHGQNDELHLVYNFPLMRTRWLTPAHIRANQEARLAAIPVGAWPCNTLGNHDTPRVRSAFGDGAHDHELARLSAALVLTLRGTPILFNGEEIGMADLDLERFEQIRDPGALKAAQMAIDLAGMSEEEAQREALAITRDRLRTPMQWCEEPHAGFCPPEAEPWLPINPNYRHGISVAAQERDPQSMLSFYRQLIALRRHTPALQEGSYTALDAGGDRALAFVRATSDQRILVALNFSNAAIDLGLPLGGARLRTIFSSHARAADDPQVDALALAPYEIRLALIEP